MRRTTVKIPDELDARLRHEAARRATTISEVVRMALEEHLHAGGRRRLSFAGAGQSASGDLSDRVEEILRDEAATEGFGSRS